MEEDLKIIREVLEGLDTDIEYVAKLASSYKAKELVGDIAVESIRYMNASDFYYCYTEVIKNLKAIKTTLRPVERRLITEEGELKPIYSILDWFVLKPLWVKCGLLEA